MRDGIAGVLSDLSESLSGVRVVTGFNRARHNVLQHRNVVGEYRDANDHTAAHRRDLRRVHRVRRSARSGRAAAHRRQHGAATARSPIGELTAFILYLNSFFLPIQQLVQQYNLYQQGQAAITKLDELLVDAPERRGGGRRRAAAADRGRRHPRRRLVRATTRRSRCCATSTSHIAAGETMALVGPTGAGKSTIAKLVTRFYDPTSGEVAIDGHDLRDVTIDSLRRQLGVVPQEPFLFAGTMRDNIAFARPSATDDEVMEAVHRVGLTELIERLPEGVDTLVHERGVSMSSGERQLIALARAFLAGPRVLVLDEATSNLDLKSETKVEAGLDAVLEGRTAIIVAHRLSTAMRADRIAVVDDGRILELGIPRRAGRPRRSLRRDVRGLDRAPRPCVRRRPGGGRIRGHRVAFAGRNRHPGEAEHSWETRSRSSTTWSSTTASRTSRPTSAPSAGRSSSTAATPARTAATARSPRRSSAPPAWCARSRSCTRPRPGVPVPYVSSVVDLDGGGDVKANVVNVEPDPEHVKLGMKVRLTTFVAGTDDEGTEAVAFGFEPA